MTTSRIGKSLLERAPLDPDVAWVLALYRYLRRNWSRWKPDLLVSTTPPHSLHSAAWLAARRFHVPWICDFRDPWDGFPKSTTGPTSWLGKQLEPRIVRDADAVVSTTRGYTNDLRKRHPLLRADKFVTITNSYPDDIAARTPQQPSPQTFTLTHTGIFYAQKAPYTFFHGLSQWLRAADSTTRHRVRVRLVGGGGQATRVVVQQLGLGDVVEFIPKVSHTNALEYSAASDLLLLCPGLSERTRRGWLPSKFIEYLGFRIPILAIAPPGEITEVIHQTRSGYVISEDNPAAVARILDAVYQRKFGSSSRATARDTFPPCKFTNIEGFAESVVFSQYEQLVHTLL